MRTKSKMAVAAVLLSFSLIALSLMTAGVQAKALKLTFEYRSGPLIFEPSGISWVSDGIQHARGRVAHQTAVELLDTDCDLTFSGEMEFVLNWNYYIKTDERTGWGTWSKVGTFLKKDEYGVWQEYLTGRVEGTFNMFRGICGKVGFSGAKGIAWGTGGDLVGYKVERFSHYDALGLVFGGTLLRPHE